MVDFDQYKFVNEEFLADSLEGNVYICGASGSGKSVLLIKTIRLLLKTLDERDIYAFDPKMTEFLPRYFATESQHKTPLIARGEDEIKEAALTLEARIKEPTFKGALLFVDEIGASPFLCDYILKEGDKLSKAGVHFVMTSQRDSVFKSLSKTSLPLVRIDLSSGVGGRSLNFKSTHKKQPARQKGGSLSVMADCLTVKDALMMADHNKLYEEILRTYQGQENQEGCALGTLLYIRECMRMKPTKNKKKALIIVRFWMEQEEGGEEPTEYRDTYLLEMGDRDDVGQFLIDNGEIPGAKDDISYLHEGHAFRADVFPSSALDSIALKRDDHDQKQAVSLAYEMRPTRDILGYYLPLLIVKKYGLERLLSVILFEMTFFGFSEKTLSKAKKEFWNSIKEAKEEVDKRFKNKH